MHAKIRACENFFVVTADVLVDKNRQVGILPL